MGTYEFTDEDLTALGLGPSSSGNMGTSIITVTTDMQAVPHSRNITVSLKGSSDSIFAAGTIYETNKIGPDADGVYIDRASHLISYTRGTYNGARGGYVVNQYLFGEIPPIEVVSGYIQVSGPSSMDNRNVNIQLMNKELVLMPY